MTGFSPELEQKENRLDSRGDDSAEQRAGTELRAGGSERDSSGSRVDGSTIVNMNTSAGVGVFIFCAHPAGRGRDGRADHAGYCIPL